jgi:DNA (cytosine-5)-methyltransferase 1
MILKLGELFCGPGGFGLGASRAKIKKANADWGFSHAWANDAHPDSCKTFVKNLCPKNPDIVKCSKVEKLDFNSLDPIDALTFGFPCNDFSNVGERKGFNGKFGELYTYGVKALDYFKPTCFVAENVIGLHHAHDGNALGQILRELAEAGEGYNVTAHPYKFEEYGVPQERHRIIIVGIKKSLNKRFRVPAPNSKGKIVTSKHALTRPPIPADAANHKISELKPRVKERLSHIPPGKNAWYEGIPKHLRLNVKGARLSQIYKRLEADEPAYTITGSGGGGTHVYHWREDRALTNREKARLQTFPDWFIFEGRKDSVRRQIGMAVPPTAARIILRAVLKTIAGIEYRSVDAKWESSNPPAAVKLSLRLPREKFEARVPVNA